MRARLITLTVLAALFTRLAPAQAGCGCDKPPPPPAAIRPAFASPGNSVSLFAPGLVAGLSYAVTFTSGSSSATVPGVAVLRRDFADATYKPQVVATVPPLPIGPTSVTVSTGLTPVLQLTANQFTMLPPPVALTEENARTVFYCYRGAVSGDGTMYIPMNIGAISQHMVFKGFGQQLPLTFNASGISIYNTQGVLMQLLGPDNPSIYAIKDDSGSSDNSFSLTYDRHEFVTYKSAHLHEGERLLDPEDPAWHLDGTRHIDHDNLVIAIRGTMRDGTRPTPGATKAFHLDITTALDGGTYRTSRNVDMCQLSSDLR